MAGARQDGDGDGLVFLASLIEQRLEDCADRALRRIHETLPALSEAGGVAREDQREQALRTLQSSISLLVDGAAPAEPDLAWCRELGHRRAQQGIPLELVVRSLHITELVLWELLADLAADIEATSPTDLLGRAATIWTALDEMANAAGEGHRSASEQFDIEHRRHALALLTLLREDPTSEHLDELARTLGLDPAASFVAAVHDGEPTPSDAALAATVVVEEPDRTLLLVQRDGEALAGEESVAGALTRAGGHLGVGLQRERLAGAALSLLDAEMAFAAAVATKAPVVSFRQAWLEVLAINHRDEYTELVDEAVARIRVAEDTTETVAAFLENVGSLSAAGRSLELHPNTVAYRLRQFAEQTGVDPRTVSGAALTQLALVLAKAGEAIMLPDTEVAAS